jgi:hypothetical protein
MLNESDVESRTHASVLDLACLLGVNNANARSGGRPSSAAAYVLRRRSPTQTQICTAKTRR